MASNQLITPEITDLVGSVISIKNPDLNSYIKTYTITSIAAAGTTLTVADNSGISNGDYIVIGEQGDSKTEAVAISGAVTKGTSLTLANTLAFSHELNSPVYLIKERAVKIYYASSDGGALTILPSIDAILTPVADAYMIEWNKQETKYAIPSTDSAVTSASYLACKFTDGTTLSSASDYVPMTGLVYNTASKLIEESLGLVNAEIDGNMITREFLLNSLNSCQDEIVSYVTQDGIQKNWSFEITSDDTSLVCAINSYRFALSDLSFDLKYPNNERAILNVRFGSKPLKYIDPQKFDEMMEGRIITTNTVATSAGDITITLGDSSEIAEASTGYIGSDKITWTGNSQSTNVLSGVPASGTGAITATWPIGTIFTYGTSPSLPEFYTIFDGYLYLNTPVDADYIYYKVKVKGLKKIARLINYSTVVEVTYVDLFKYFIGSRIEYRKGNKENGDRLYQTFQQRLEINALADTVQSTENSTRYDFPFSGASLIEDDNN